jgi:hypothetical protein
MEGTRRPEPVQPEEEHTHIDTIAQELAKVRKAVAILLKRLSPDLREAYAYDLQRISAFASNFIYNSKAKVSEPTLEEIENEIRKYISPGGREEIGIPDLIAYIRDGLATVIAHKSFLVEGSTLSNDLENPPQGKSLKEFIQLLDRLLDELKKSQ